MTNTSSKHTYILLFILLFASIYNEVYSQQNPGFCSTYDFENGTDEFLSIFATQDSGFIACGISQLIVNYRHNPSNVLVVKTDKNGETIWSKTYGTENEHEQSRSETFA